MLAARAVAFSLCALLAGCGYIGPVVPPSPEIPNPVTDLSVSEIGDNLSIKFTTPARTTDNLAMKKLSAVDLRIGVPPEPFNAEAWAQSAKPISVPLPAPAAQESGVPLPFDITVAAKDWIGKHVVVLVRTASKKTESAWSNPVSLNVIEPLPRPDVKVTPTRAGYRLSWSAEGSGVEYRIFRASPGDKTPVEIGSTSSDDFVDHSSQWNTLYTYTVVAHQGSAESLPSQPQEATSADIFPPSAPTDLTAAASANAVEVAWQRSPESDVKGYYVYRSTDGGPFDKQGGLVPLPAYTDTNVEHGKTYRYEVSAVSAAGNESEKSAAAETVFP